MQVILKEMKVLMVELQGVFGIPPSPHPKKTLSFHVLKLNSTVNPTAMFRVIRGSITMSMSVQDIASV